MSDKTYNSQEVAKLKQLFSEILQVKAEIEALTTGQKETVKAYAEEMDIKPALLNKAIKIAYKAEFGKVADEFDDLETLLETVGRTL